MRNRLYDDENDSSSVLNPFTLSMIREKERERESRAWEFERQNEKKQREREERLDRLVFDKKERVRDLFPIPELKPSTIYPTFPRVKEWAHVCNPVIGTCRHCGTRDFVNDPVIGLY